MSLTASIALLWPLSGCTLLSGKTTPDLSSVPDRVDRLGRNQSLDWALADGKRRAQDAAVHFSAANFWYDLPPSIEPWLVADRERCSAERLANLGALMDLAPPAIPPLIFAALETSSCPWAVKGAWRIAARRPSPAMAAAVADSLGRKILSHGNAAPIGQEEAAAVGANRVAAAYPLLRHSLLKTRDLSYAKAMCLVEPQRASEDLLGYLARLDRHRRSRGGRSGARDAGASVVLNHLLAHPPSLHNPDFGTLFSFASRSPEAGGPTALKILQRYLPDNAELMALLLSQQPTPTQLRVIELIRHASHEIFISLLSEMSATTSNREVQSKLEVVREDVP